MIYFEYSNFLVEAGHVPSRLCCSDRHEMSWKMSMAERAYSIENNKLIEIKNRNSAPSTMHISDEDKVVLKLKAVLI